VDCLNGPSYLTKHISRAFGCFARSEMPREPVPSSIADPLLVSVRHLCCMCEHPATIIHHINENNSDNDPDNLIPLCPNCHARVHSRPIMTRGITRNQQKLYRKNAVKKFANLRSLPAAEVTRDEFEELSTRVLSLEHGAPEAGEQT